MSPRDRDHCRGGKSSLIIENFGTGNQAIKPKLPSFRKQCNQPVRAASDWLRFATECLTVPRPKSASFRKQCNQPVRAASDWLRFATECLTVPQPKSASFRQKKRNQPVRALPGSASFRDVVPDHHSARLASLRKNLRPKYRGLCHGYARCQALCQRLRLDGPTQYLGSDNLRLAMPTRSSLLSLVDQHFPTALR
jgi:hypothetical protein